MLKPYRKGANR